MNDYEVACKGLAESINGALLCGVIEVASGHVLALHSTDGAAPDFEQAFVRSSLELLRGPSHQLLGASADSVGVFPEIQLMSAHTCHIAKTLGDGSRALVLVTRKDVNVGLGWAEVKVTAAALDRSGR